MNKPQISVIIPVYQSALWLRECVDSVREQTVRELEILLVDDGSTDGSGAICDEYEHTDDRIRVIRQENRGVSAARNAGLAAARGEWITFVDADDRLESDAIEYYLHLTETYGADAAQCGMAVEEETTVSVAYCTASPKLFAAGDEWNWFCLANSVCNKLYRAETVRGIRFDEAYPIGEDLLFNLLVLKRGAVLVCGNQVKYHYRQHTSSACHRAPTPQRMTSYRRVLTRALELFDDEPAALRFFRTQQLRNDLDICSKIVRFPSPEYGELRREIQRELRRRSCRIGGLRGLAGKERGKALLAAWSWGLYRRLLLLSKKRR